MLERIQLILASILYNEIKFTVNIRFSAAAQQSCRVVRVWPDVSTGLSTVSPVSPVSLDACRASFTHDQRFV